MSITAHERRRAERLALGQPLPARLADRDVLLHDIGILGTCVEHRAPIVAGDAPQRLAFSWDGEEIALDCTVARSERLHADAYLSGLTFAEGNGHAARALRRMLDDLAHAEEIERLRQVVEASKLINSSIEPEALFQSILTVARRELGVDRGTLWFVDEERQEIWSRIAENLEEREIRLPIGKGLAGTVAATGEPVVLHDAYADERFDRSLDQRTGYRTRSMLCVPIHNRDRRVVGVLQLLNRKHGSFAARDLEFLDAISEHMAIAMENATLHLGLIEKDRMQRELQLGREIQSKLLPKPPSDLASTRLAATSIPCFEVGGDYYDFIELADGDVGLAIGDVSGKGVAAALVMSSLQAALRVAAPLERDLARLMARLNGLLYRMTGGRKYVTFFFGRYTPSTGELRYVNAGHNPPFVACEGALTKIDSTGRPIGLLPDASYEERSVTLAPGCTLFLYTDGLNEAANPDEEELGMPRLEELLAEASTRDVDDAASSVLREVERFEAGAHATDDKTLVVVRRV